MPFDSTDPALAAVENRNRVMDTSDAYYNVFQPNRNLTIGRSDYYDYVCDAAEDLEEPFCRIQIQGAEWVSYGTVEAACRDWRSTGFGDGKGMDFLHIHRSENSRFRVYIPADLRHVDDIIEVLWDREIAPGLTGFKVAGYDDANNRTDVMVAWVQNRSDVRAIAAHIPDDWLHGMRPPGSTIITAGCLIGYSQEVSGSSMGTEVTNALDQGQQVYQPGPANPGRSRSASL